MTDTGQVISGEARARSQNARGFAARDPGDSKSLPTSGRRREGLHPCQAHHVVWWDNGGPTKVDNGVLLCGHHHRCVHEGGWELSFDPATGVVSVTSPDGTIVRTADPPGFDLTLPGERPPG